MLNLSSNVSAGVVWRGSGVQVLHVTPGETPRAASSADETRAILALESWEYKAPDVTENDQLVPL
jgi:hypothetical protein